jgi:hypothetical protein
MFGGDVLHDFAALFRGILPKVAPFGSIQTCEHDTTVAWRFLLDHARFTKSLVAADDARPYSYIVEFHVRLLPSRAIECALSDTARFLCCV